MNILGINPCFTANHHDPSACLMQDGRVIAAIEEERLNRVKTSIGLFPSRSIKFCLDYAKLSIEDIDFIASPGITSPELVDKIKGILLHDYGYSPPIKLWPHYLCHAAGSFYSSGFKDALVISADGYGDGISTWIGLGSSTGLSELATFPGKCSIGNFYAQLTEHLGFIRTEGEFKVMGMAAYGNPKYDLSEFIKSTKDSYWSDSSNLTPKYKITSTFEPSVNHQYLLDRGLPQRYSLIKEFTQEHFDLAASIQMAFESAYLGIIRTHKGVNEKLCLSGGSALNCLANGKLLEEFSDVYVMPASSDRGLSLGAAYLQSDSCGERNQPPDDMFLGGEFNDTLIKAILDKNGVAYEYVGDPGMEAAKDIGRGKIIGWHQGRSEFGPRALGGRSILASPLKLGMKAEINQKIKYREEYRPFAPAILGSEAQKYGITRKLPYMTFAIKPSSALSGMIPETIHADGTARLQTVDHENHPLFKILTALKKDGQFPSVINTSFNLSGEPMVESPADAIRTFYSCGLDVLYIGNFRLIKNIPT